MTKVERPPRHRWNFGQAAEAYDRGLWVHTTLADSLADAAQRTPHRVVVVDSETRLDCVGLHTQAGALAQAMLARIPVGSVVSFVLPNWHEAAVIYLAATMAGMVVNPILPSLRDRELKFILSDAETRMMFIPNTIRGFDYGAMLSRVTAQLDTPPEVVVLRGEHGNHTSYSALFDAHPAGIELPMLNPDAVRMMLYTSGTTGRPKAVLHSHNSLHALICQLRDNWLIDPGDKFLVPSPIAHIGGSIYAFECPLLLGTTAVLMERWDADDAVALLQAEHCTHMAGATPFLEQILAALEKTGVRADARGLPDLKVFICGGASVPPSLIRRAASYFTRALVTRVYGSTEVPVTTVGATTLGDIDHAADTDGRAGIAEIKLVAHSFAPADAGELRVRGPQMLLGYLHPDDEQDAFDDEGFFRTGDLASWVDGDYVVITGRAKDIIIRNGENIAPKEVEDILIGHPGIAEIAIVGRPDSRTGERACAVIVPVAISGPGTETRPEITVADLHTWLAEQGVATFKVPEQVAIWQTLPKNDAGKVLKHQIRAELTKADG